MTIGASGLDPSDDEASTSSKSFSTKTFFGISSKEMILLLLGLGLETPPSLGCDGDGVAIGVAIVADTLRVAAPTDSGSFSPPGRTHLLGRAIRDVANSITYS